MLRWPYNNGAKTCSSGQSPSSLQHSQRSPPELSRSQAPALPWGRNEGKLQRDLVIRDGEAWERLEDGDWQELPKLRTLSEMAAFDGGFDWALDSMSDATCITAGPDTMTFHFTLKSAGGTEAWNVKADQATFRPLAIESISEGPERTVVNWTYEYDPTLTISPPTIHL